MQRFTLEERKRIEDLIHRGFNAYQIAREVNRSYNSIRNEISGHGGREKYSAERVELYLQKRRAQKIWEKPIEKMEEKKATQLEERVDLLEQQQKLIFKLLKERNGIDN